MNGDGRNALIWQHDGGTVAAWLMNDTTLVHCRAALAEQRLARHVADRGGRWHQSRRASRLDLAARTERWRRG